MSLNSFYLMSLSLKGKRTYFNLANNRTLYRFGPNGLGIATKDNSWVIPTNHDSTTDALLLVIANYKGENLLAEGASPILRERLDLASSTGFLSDEYYYQQLREAVRPLAITWLNEFAPGATLGSLVVRKESTAAAVYRLAASAVVELTPGIKIPVRLIFAPDPNHENAWGIRPEIGVSERNFDLIHDRVDNANRMMQSECKVRPLWAN